MFSAAKDRLILLLTTVSLVSVLASCESADMTAPGEDSKSNSLSHITVNTRALDATDALYYPISLYVYPKTGGDVTVFTISEADVNGRGWAETILPYGTYSVHAFSGTRSFVDGYASSPLYYGSETLIVADEEVDLHMVLKSAVAKVNATITHVPSDIDAVTIVLEPQYADIADNGALSGSVQAKVNCTKSDEGVWTTGDFYVLPGTSTATVISIEFVDGTESENYNVTYSSPLKANTPYDFTFAYKGLGEDSGSVSASFSLGAWESAVSKTFDFGPGSETPADSHVLYVDDYPSGVTNISGHVVIPLDESHLALLYSKQEWQNVGYGSSLNDIEGAATYSEGDITEWAIPTRKEAELLIEKCGGGEKSRILQQAIGYAGGKPSDNPEALFLCDDCHSTYSFTNNASVKDASATETYKLRLVRTVQLMKR